MDRQIPAILLEPIRRDLGASDTEMGLLTGFAVVWLFALASVPIARAADRYSRRNIIAVALTFWSITTMSSGYVATFLQLAAARVGWASVKRQSHLQRRPSSRISSPEITGQLRWPCSPSQRRSAR
jgi:MFS family permease